MRISRLIRAAMLAASVTAPVGVKGQGFDSGALVKVALSDTIGAPIQQPTAGVPFRVLVQLSDPANDRPVTDEHLRGWIRPVEASNGTCSDTGRSNILAGDSLPRGTVDLARSLYGVRHADGTMSIVDWQHSIASANTLAIVALPGAVGPLAALPDQFAFLAKTGDGQTIRVSAAAGTEPEFLAGHGPALVAPNGWATQGRQIIAPDGNSMPLPSQANGLSPALFDTDTSRYQGALALLDGGGAVLADAESDRFVQGPTAATDAAYSAHADAMLFADGSDQLQVVYGGKRAITAPLPAPASRVTAAPKGEIALAWSPESPAVSVIDVATGTLLQAIEMNRAPLNQPVREVAFARDTAFLLLHDLDFAVVLDLRQARRGEAVAARPVRIGPAVRDLPDDAGPFLIQTVRGYESSTILALHPDLSTAFPLTSDSGNATAPMNGFRIAGARPLSMAELSAALTEAQPGEYRAATVLSQGGPHELIVSAGPGRFTACVNFDVTGETADVLALRMQAEAYAQDTQPGLVIDLRLVDDKGVGQRWPIDMPLILQSLQGGWRDRITAHPIPTGGHRAVIAGAPAGLISIAFDHPLSPGITIDPTTIEVRP